MPPRTMGGAKEKKKNTSRGTSKDTTSKDPTSKASSSLQRYDVSDDSKNEATPSKDVSDAQPMQPLKFFFNHSEFNKQTKIQTRCYLSKFFGIIEELKPELEWFRRHPQFQHFFHMAKEPNRKLMGMWMLLLRTVCVDRKTVVWFVVNGVPIRYSLREHGLISGLCCHEYPKEFHPTMDLVKYRNKFKERQFRNKEKITVRDVEEKLQSMKKSCPDRLKMAILYFLATVLRGKAKVDGYIDAFLLRMAEDPDLCKTYSWGRLTFEDSVKDIYHAMAHMKGKVPVTLTFPGFIVPLEILAFECIPNLKSSFREDVEADKKCPRMCKQKFIGSSMKGFPLEDVYHSLDSTKDIQSILVPELEEEYLLARILGDEADDEALDMIPDSWNQHLAENKICWEELYSLDLASRKTKEQEEETGSSQAMEPVKNHALFQLLKDMEDRLGKRMTEEFDKVNTATKDLGKKLRVLRKKVKDLESEVRGGRENAWDGFERANDENEGAGFERLEEEEKQREEKEKEAEEEETELEQEEDKEETDHEKEKETEHEKEEEKEREEKEQEDVAKELAVVVYERNVIKEKLMDFFGQKETEHEEEEEEKEKDTEMSEGEEEDEGPQAVNKKGKQKSRTPRVTRNSKPSQFKKSPFTQDGNRKTGKEGGADMAGGKKRARKNTQPMATGKKRTRKNA